MNITIEAVSENKDGSANCDISFDAEGLKYLIQHAVIDILTKYAEQHPIKQPDKDAKPHATASKRKASTKAGVQRRTRYDAGRGG